MSQPHSSTKKISFLDLIWHYKFHLALYIVVISFASFAGLYAIGGVPTEFKILDQKIAEQPVETLVQTTYATSTSDEATTTTPAVKAVTKASENLAEKPSTGLKTAYSVGTDYPLRIVIDKINVDTSVSNPTSIDNTILNNALLTGAVRYPASGTLGHGNMLIFGHNTGIKVVHNQAYKAFNHLKDLVAGDVIRVQSLDTEYNYRVTSVTLENSNDAFVSFSNDTNMLTLSTCDVFGQKEDRYVVQGVFIKSVSLQ